MYQLGTSPENPGEFVEVLFKYSSNAISISPTQQASLGINTQNKYLKSCIDIIEL